MITSKKITIFEGADGSGKSTAADVFCKKTGAKYFHFGAYPGETHIAHHYLEVMAQALMGTSDIVMDRSWFDEEPYGIAFRGGVDRIGCVGRQIFRELAMRCGGLVVVCSPPWEVVQKNYLSRRHMEYLETPEQLKVVYDYFNTTARTYPMTFPYDYTRDPDLDPEYMDKCRTKCQSAMTSNEIYLLLTTLIKGDDSSGTDYSD